MPVNVDNFQEFEAKLVEAATTSACGLCSARSRPASERRPGG